ncbi:MAG: hypothetical protein IPJ65_40745 [Archangiaceae bacterium]|nr:hypothetical protein [Archangiaceae bacterium]
MRRLCLFGVLVVAAGCAHAPPPKREPSPVAEYYPLAVGNTWSYEGEMLGGPAKFDISIVKEERGRFTDSQDNVLTIDSYGIRDEKRYLLRTPLEVGTRWNNVVSVSSYEQYAIVEAGQACDAPAGRYLNCVVVESRNKGDGEKVLVNTLTFAPKVGMIRIATALETQGKRIPQARLELTRFQVGQGTPAPAASPEAPAPAR